MRIRKALLVAFAAALSACAKAHNDPVARGRAVFASYDCKKCHAVAGVGGSLGPDLTFVGFRKEPAFLDTWLKDPGAWKADVSMPNFHFQPGVRADLVAYLSTLKGEGYLAAARRPWDAPEFSADPVKRGEEIYRRTGCISCHNKGGKGGYPNNNVVGGLVPALVNVSDGFTKEEVVKKVLEGVRHPVKQDPAGPEPLLYMPKWEEKLKKDEVEAVADYLFSLKPKTSGGESW
ncbi:MAG: c-type cytochrome [Elusimicrobia bacterium]|nr:c-type cytochrome [Elusimicrobiota bacterium]